MAANRSRGDALFEVVEEYSALGEHRTGTPVDLATAEWLAARLEKIGARVERVPFAFERYEARWRVNLDGEEVPSIPLFYEGVGRVRTTRPLVATVRVRGGAVLSDWGRVVERGRRDGAEAAVMATDFGTGRLCAVNREPVAGSGLPTLCVAGALGERLAESEVEVDLDARIVPGEGYNVLARLGDGRDESRVLLTTPISGWFRCAGERGTGIAVALAVAEALSEHCPVSFVGASGHELQGLGGKHHLATADPREKAVFHFGASVASGESDGVRPPTQRSRALRPTAWAGDALRAELEASLAPLGVSVRLLSDAEARDPAQWIGESALWAPLGRPLVSIAGGFPLHHAPEDVPALATTPALLEASYEAALGAARVLASV